MGKTGEHSIKIKESRLSLNNSDDKRLPQPAWHLTKLRTKTHQAFNFCHTN